MPSFVGEVSFSEAGFLTFLPFFFRSGFVFASGRTLRPFAGEERTGALSEAASSGPVDERLDAESALCSSFTALSEWRGTDGPALRAFLVMASSAVGSKIGAASSSAAGCRTSAGGS